MEQEFWRQRWREGRIGFHRADVMPWLQKHWPALALPEDSRVLVPLCGKTLDMPWLAAQGHRVLGVELSDLAIEQFLAENHLSAQTQTSPQGILFDAGPIQLLQGDAFTLDDATLATCTGIYDRAAMIALPPDLRQRYFETVYARLPVGTRGLLITLEYPQQEKSGPPFAVTETEIRERFADAWRVDCLERRDILAHEPGFGTSTLETVVYRLERLS